MNQNEALEEAVRRWGKKAHVRYRQGLIHDNGKPYAVGRWDGKMFDILGQGETWEKAFEEETQKRHP